MFPVFDNKRFYSVLGTFWDYDGGLDIDDVLSYEYQNLIFVSSYGVDKNYMNKTSL